MKTRSVVRVFLSVTLLVVMLVWACGPKGGRIILDAEDQYALAKREFELKHFDRAVVELEKLILNYPGVGFIDSAHYLLGTTYFRQKEYPLAIGEFNRLLSSFPTSPLADKAALKVAESDVEMSPRAELDQEHTLKAMDEVKNFLNDYPQSDQREPALGLLNKCRAKLAFKAYKAARVYYTMGHYDSAVIYLKQVLSDYQDTEWAKPAQFQLAEVLYEQKKYREAKEEYQKFVQTFPNDKLAGQARKRLEKIGKLGIPATTGIGEK
jgi:outer membrane protein assembly factor BamD